MLTVPNGMRENAENVHNELILALLVSAFLSVITVGLGIILTDFVSLVTKDINLKKANALNLRLTHKALLILVAEDGIGIDKFVMNVHHDGFSRNSTHADQFRMTVKTMMKMVSAHNAIQAMI